MNEGEQTKEKEEYRNTTERKSKEIRRTREKGEDGNKTQ
jgi:hypothetical protein